MSKNATLQPFPEVRRVVLYERIEDIEARHSGQESHQSLS
jgi:hypothetical protein